MSKSIILNKIAKVFNYFFQNKNVIIYNSFPDFSDNSFALYCYISNHFSNYTNIWLVNNISLKEDYLKLASNYTNIEKLEIVKKKSFPGIYYYLTSRIIFHTHGIFNFFGLISTQTKINLWHGMPIKKVGYFDSPNCAEPISDYHVASSKFYQDIMSKVFGVSNKKVLITGQVRNDFLIQGKTSINKLFSQKREFKKTILWMPTYRKSVIGDIRVDGKVNPDIDFLSEENLSRINKILIKTESICYVKLHPMDYLQVEHFRSYSNLVFIDNDSFLDNGVAMYSVFNSVDILLTDFSSIYIDFMLLNKPIGFVFSDYDEFKNSRGFVFSDPKKYMPGEFITSIDKLKMFLTEVIINENDNYKNKREEIKNIFHAYERDFSKKLLEKIM